MRANDALRLPNGYTAVIGHNERLETGQQGPGTVDVMGDEVVVLDQSFNAVWAWNAFDFLPVNRPALLGETCKASGANGCPLKLASVANDWLHGNSLFYDATDGNIVMSLRNQDWVVKFAYQNATGDGHLIWTLGNQGDFTMLNTPGVSSPWFSHQHDVAFQSSTAPRSLSLFDSGLERLMRSGANFAP